MVETNAADVYGFDLDRLRALADEIGPTVDAVAEVLAPDDYPRLHLQRLRQGPGPPRLVMRPGEPVSHGR